jgi:FmdE, Molybdenum formylmethanofuran dehydrogenase operon
MTLGIFMSFLAFLIIPVGRSETAEQCVALLTRVHGGFGSFLPVGIRVVEDAMKRLNARPRELDVTFFQGEGTPCPCAADGVSLAVYASAGQGTLCRCHRQATQGRRRSEIHRADVCHAEAK